MKLATMTAREQVLVIVTAAVFIGGAYGLLRYRPALKALAELQTQTQQTEDRLKTTSIPEAPDEDMADLQDARLAAEDKFAAVQARLVDLEQRLPPADSQEVSLRISELAQLANLLVRKNESYKLGTAAVSNTSTAAEGSRKARRAARRAAGGAVPAVTGITPSTEPSIGLEMLNRYANPDFTRPMQQVTLEGYYSDIRYFLDALQKFNWQVTVAQLQIETDSRPNELGMPQTLRAHLILAL